MLFCVFLGNKINDLNTISKISSEDVFTWDLILIIFLFVLILITRILLKKKSN